MGQNELQTGLETWGNVNERDDMQGAPIGAPCISSPPPPLACFYSAPPAWNPTAVDSRQPLRQKPLVLRLDRGLIQKPFRPDRPHCHHQMGMMIPDIGFPMRRMHRKIDRRPIAIRQPLRECATSPIDIAVERGTYVDLATPRGPTCREMYEGEYLLVV